MLGLGLGPGLGLGFRFGFVRVGADHLLDLGARLHEVEGGHGRDPGRLVRVRLG